MKTNNYQNTGLDPFTPILELFMEMINLMLKAFISFLTWGAKKVFKLSPAIEKIELRLINRKKTTSNQDALGVDLNNKKDLLLADIDTRRHSFIVGASGFGKTNLISILQEHSLKKGVPLLFIDPKGDLEAMQTFKDLCESYGKPCYIFSEHYENSVQMNPLLEGSINQVADRIMRAFEWSEQFYKDMSYRALIKVLNDLKLDGKEFSLKNIHSLLVSKYESSDITGLIVKIESILASDFGPLLNGTKDDQTISKIRKEGACLYIGLSTQGYGEMAMSIGKLFLEELLYNSYKTLTDPLLKEAAKTMPISVYFDEFGALVTPQFIELQNKCRGAGIELTMAVQTPADINRVDPELTKQVIENASNIFIMKQRLQEGAELFSESLGTVLTIKKTEATDEGEKSGKGTERETHELIVHPDVIKSLKVGQCVLLRHDPVRVNLLNIRLRETAPTAKFISNEIVIKSDKGAF